MVDPSGGYATFILYTLIVSGIVLGFVYFLRKISVKKLLIGTFITVPVIFVLMTILSTRPLN